MIEVLRRDVLVLLDTPRAREVPYADFLALEYVLCPAQGDLQDRKHFGRNGAPRIGVIAPAGDRAALIVVLNVYAGKKASVSF